MPALLPRTCLSIYLALVCLLFLMGWFTPNTPETKLYFISPAMKSNVNKIFFMAKRNFIPFIFHFGSHINIRYASAIDQFFTKLTNTEKHFMSQWKRALIFRKAHNSVVFTKVKCVSENQWPVKSYLFFQTKKAL